jgi:flagellar biosynthetic protein FliQ
MNDFIHLAGQALWLILLLSLPPLLASLIVGLVISLLQALTQVQEQTLTFVPKIIAVIVTTIIFAEWMLARLHVFARQVFQMILKAGTGL